MSYLLQVERGIDFIEAHLDEDVSLAAIARHARVSAWHFQRIFKGLTGDTLKSYVRARRLSRALDALLWPGARTIDVALGAGFTSQAAFTRAFKLRSARRLVATGRRSCASNTFASFGSTAATSNTCARTPRASRSFAAFRRRE